MCCNYDDLQFGITYIRDTMYRLQQKMYCPKFIAVFSAPAYNFKVTFYTVICCSYLQGVLKNSPLQLFGIFSLQLSLFA